MRAETCARSAAEAQDDYHRKNFQQLAVMWTEMADKAEGRIAQRDVDDAIETIRRAGQLPARNGG
ncbi:MAG: hypothetical protein KF748_06540 [Xanthobacteraceae bacterium]|nr:hypothetical protein [Xanthobacteraceae bacterium]